MHHLCSRIIINMIKISTHQTFTCSKSTIETLEKTAFNVNIFHTFSSASIVEFEQFNFLLLGNWYMEKGSCIDLIFTNRKHCFKNTLTFETSLGNHQHIIHSMLRITLKRKKQPNKFVYRDFKNLDNNFQFKLK